MTLTAELQVARKTIADLEAKNAGCARQLAQAVQGKQEAEGNVVELQRQVESLRARCEKQRQSLVNVQTTNQRVVDLEAALEAMTLQAKQAEAARRKSEDKLKVIQRDLDAAQSTASAQESQAADAAVQIGRRVRDLESQLHAALEQVSAAERAQQTSAVTVAELRCQVEEWRARAEQTGVERATAERSLRAMEQRANTLALLDELPSPWPWMRREASSPQRYVPRWKKQDTVALGQLQNLSEVLLAKVPEQLISTGHADFSRVLRAWLQTPSLLRPSLVQKLVLRIVSTPRSKRSSEEQIATMADLVLADSLRQIAVDEPELSDELRAGISSSWETYVVLSRSFLHLCVSTGAE